MTVHVLYMIMTRSRKSNLDPGDLILEEGMLIDKTCVGFFKNKIKYVLVSAPYTLHVCSPGMKCLSELSTFAKHLIQNC